MAPQMKFDVMISYDPKSGTDYMKKLLAELENKKYYVWVDVKRKENDVYNSFANAINASYIVIAIVSKRYEASSACRSELQNADMCKKEVIIVKTEDFYLPKESWLSPMYDKYPCCKLYGGVDETTQLLNAVGKLLHKCKAGPGSTQAPEEQNIQRDESSAQSFDVIFSFDIKSGMQDKDRLLPFLARAGFSVCNEKHKKMFDFHEIWADTMAVSFVVILLLSHNYEETEACMMQLHTARLAEKKIIPIKTEEFELTEDSKLKEFLSDVPSYKVYEDFEENVEKVVGAVKEHINAIKSSKAKGNKTSERDKSFSNSSSSQQYARRSNSDGSRKASASSNNEDSNSNVKRENSEPYLRNSTINVFGGTVVIGDTGVINISNGFNGGAEQRGAAPQSCEVEGKITVSKPSPAANKACPSCVQETSNPEVPVSQAPTVSKESIPPLSGKEALELGQERSTSDFNEDIRDELAMKLGNQSGVVANWVDVARFLRLEAKVIQRIEDKGTAHRLLFKKIRDDRPELKLSDIKDILEKKMKRRLRKDIFYDYEKGKDLPTLDRELGSLDDNEFELVLENVADRLIADRVRGSWRHVGGHLGLEPTELDEIMNEGRADNATGSARMFIDVIVSRTVTVKQFIDALESDKVKRNDIALFIRERLKDDDCWTKSCAFLVHNSGKTLAPPYA